MGRHFLAAGVVAADTALLVAGHRGPLWVAALYAVTAALAYRMPLVAFGAALALSTVGGAAFVLLLWTGYLAGRAIATRRDALAVTAAALAAVAVQAARAPHGLPQVATTAVVFMALPLLVGRYLAQQDRLAATLADQARLHERLRIARDMHDSLGRRLSLVSIQAAALEVTPLPPPQQRAVRQLATAARQAMTEVYEVVGALREPTDVAALVADFRAAGVPVTLSAPAQPLPPAAYRVVEEGLTNAAKHAPGQPVAVAVERSPRDLRVTVVNPAPSRPATAGGHGLIGLSERVRLAGGLLRHEYSDGAFRLSALLPHAAPAVPRVRPVLLGVAAAALMFIVLPASLLLGVG
ncbi:sensor histidine kinase [Phytohabitans rumicis]|uniref:histidine kinase n=1 Tax=Phytohabitans rumicis TaxID=1076125 RepID=A0A6V8LBR5_9ACTN|nr:histidine kinase [Phytohabitans rumicis]GFJ93070.1 hypothetical protein Prum_067120 [Phytohabitans rumicis]